MGTRKALRRYPQAYWAYLLNAPLSVRFSTPEAARAFRRDFYNFRQSLRIESPHYSQVAAADRLTLRLSGTTVYLLPAHQEPVEDETPISNLPRQ